MKAFLKTILFITLFTLSANASAQTDKMIFNHLGVGVHASTTGFGFEAATPITRFVTLRGGVSIMPGFSFNTDVDGSVNISESGVNREVPFSMDIDGSLKRVQGSIIFNVYPFAGLNSFYIGAGAYFGGNDLVKISGHSNELAEYGISNGAGYVEIGDYHLPVDRNGNVNGSLRVNAFRPYIGVGYGRAVPKKLLNFGVELGVQFHGKMKVYTSDGQELNSVGDTDDDWQKIMDKLVVYPVLKFTLSGKIF